MEMREFVLTVPPCHDLGDDVAPRLESDAAEVESSDSTIWFAQTTTLLDLGFPRPGRDILVR
jgi:hypothetical protein